ncbi:TPA: transcriptional regulator [Serratia marcescens]|uniref:Winged helix-turn-helix domain-containing protein n=1 Tax=Serratia nevei TaxID=2703794 RepID=A0AAW6X8B4_9GAMM|nr:MULTISPECIES: winged helix-turn-helix domain-containing protein [Serratia]MDK4767289.1 winged helix-turn-helix domain-containing protein [Serratia nevei]MDK4770646.1 winged helix-turn-helix domain-containing protein [Serratia nevei]MDK4796799.1 winged helix-turn-helix domain-containing protein [Serratia nevei]MDK4801384.1 winged helix-turn-helix domain-containing protein [Serratia nevei]MDK4859246.1 winged helix-turn-helix domain-containing protein [Serratia nevei]
MIYIIDKDITFNTENGSLKSITKGREVFLSSVNTRVFKCLLEHSHEAVSRETLLRQVWTDHGLSASSATLNQYICLTRRALASVGFNERLIVTLSKKGYRLNRIIPINRQSVDFPEPPETAEAPVSPVTEPPKNSHYLFILLRSLSIVVPLSFLVLCSIYYKHHRDGERKQVLSYLGSINGCPIYYVGNFFGHRQDDYFRLLARNDLYGQRCRPGEIVITKVNRSHNANEDSGRQFIAKCTKDSAAVLHNCESEYIRAWKKS